MKKMIKVDAKELNRAVELLKLSGIEVELETVTAKAESDSKSVAEKKEYDLPYTVGKDGKTVTVGGKGHYAPKPVFYACTSTIKENGGKWNPKNKQWDFDTKKACKAFEDAWKAGKKQ